MKDFLYAFIIVLGAFAIVLCLFIIVALSVVLAWNFIAPWAGYVAGFLSFIIIISALLAMAIH